MVIRDEQMSAFTKESSDDFRTRMAIHLRKCFVPECEALKDAGVRELIQYGIDQAATHEVVAERDVCKYIDLMMVFGRDFDTKLAWALQILKDRVVRSATARVDRLFVEAKGKQADKWQQI